MKKTLLCLFFLTTFLILRGEEGPEIKLPPKKQFLLVLMIGQSNMAGRGVPEASDQVPNPRILKMERSGKWVPAVAPVHYDKQDAGTCLGSTFAERLLADNPDAVIGLIPAACGGSSLADWQPGTFFAQTKSHPFDDAMIRARLACREGTLTAILWHQGESDSHEAGAAVYEAELRKLITRIREELHAEDVPVIFGALSRDPAVPRSRWAKIIDQAQRKLAKEMQPAAYAGSEGLTLKSDRLHFDRRSLIVFGNRYYDAFLSIPCRKQLEYIPE